MALEKSLRLVAAAAIVGCFASPAVGQSAPTATTLNGTYLGRYNPEYDQDFFLGMPYAQPPIGDLRFANPQSITTSFNDTRDATEYSAQCLGYGVSVASSAFDCQRSSWSV